LFILLGKGELGEVPVVKILTKTSAAFKRKSGRSFLSVLQGEKAGSGTNTLQGVQKSYHLTKANFRVRDKTVTGGVTGGSWDEGGDRALTKANMSLVNVARGRSRLFKERGIGFLSTRESEKTWQVRQTGKKFPGVRWTSRKGGRAFRGLCRKQQRESVPLGTK